MLLLGDLRGNIFFSYLKYLSSRPFASSQASYPSLPRETRKLSHSAARPFQNETISLGFVLVTAYLKYLSSRPFRALPWRASSRAISWTVSWIMLLAFGSQHEGMRPDRIN